MARRSLQTPEERKLIARLGGIARAAKGAARREQASLLPTNVIKLVPVTDEVTPGEALCGSKIGDDPQGYIDRRWTPRLIRFFEQTMQSYTRRLDGFGLTRPRRRRCAGSSSDSPRARRAIVSLALPQAKAPPVAGRPQAGRMGCAVECSPGHPAEFNTPRFSTQEPMPIAQTGMRDALAFPRLRERYAELEASRI